MVLVAYSVKNLLLNELLVDSTSTCFMNLFHLQVDSLTFISSISCPWKNSYVAISDALVSSKLPAHNIKIGILDENGNVFTFHKADSLFSTDKSYEQGWRIMQIVIVSDSNSKINYLNLELFYLYICFYYLVKVTFGKEEFSTANLSIFPKFIAHLAAFELRRQSEVDPDVSTSRYLRRLISVAIDNGVAVDLIDFCKLKIDKDTELSHQHFDSVVLRLQEHVDKFEDEAIKDELELPLFNCRHFLSETSNESSICSLFWNLVINTLFKSEASLYDKQNYRIELEWSTRNLYPTANHRKVDLVCVIDLERSCGESVPIPMLCVESGMYPFTWESQHKDLSKILGMMSANCVTLAHELIKAGKRPELAKVYGMLIGGTKVQFCVAEAVITQKIDDEKVFEVHANISFNKKWFFDIFDSLPPSSRSNLSPPIPHIKRLFEISPFLGLDIPEIHFKPEVKEAATLEEVGANSEFYGEVLNYFGLKNVKAFIEIIKSQIHLIFASPVDDAKDEIKRTFESPSRDFYFSKSLDQSRDTPKTGRVSESNNWEGDPPASPIPSRLGQESFPTTFNQSKTSKFEFELYKKCAILFSSFFPRIYDMREESTQSTEEEKKSFFYKFELMSPLVSPELGCSKILLGSDDSLENLVQVIKLSIDCLYGLFLLHSVLNVLHCDISPVNIMYSEIDSIWKIIDFDSSVEGVDQGGRLQIIRNQIVGTRGFIAPESLERGEYTELSDIFALGTVIFDLLYPKLYHQFGEDGEHCKYLYSFEAILLGMNDPNYKNRSSLKSCLSKLFSLLKKILPDDSLILKDQVSCAVQILESNQFTLGIDPIKHGVDRKMRPPSIPFKYLPSTRTVEEKEPSGMTVENTVSTSNKFII